MDLPEAPRTPTTESGREASGHRGRALSRRGLLAFPDDLNLDLLRVAVRVWLTEILVSGFNFFVLMDLVYQPLFGELRAHQIGMSTRIVYIFVFSYLLLRYSAGYTRRDLVQLGFLWLGLTLAFEWGGSLAIGRPVHEILIGWKIWKGYMWPFVLLAYFSANLIVGIVLHPAPSAARTRPGANAPAS